MIFLAKNTGLHYEMMMYQPALIWGLALIKSEISSSDSQNGRSFISTSLIFPMSTLKWIIGVKFNRMSAVYIDITILQQG